MTDDDDKWLALVIIAGIIAIAVITVVALVYVK